MAREKITNGIIYRQEFPNRTYIKREDGEEIALKGGLIGQEVKVKVTARGKKGKGKIIETLRRSPQEITPPCPHAPICGGCTYQTLPYEEETALKAHLIGELFETDVPYSPSPQEFRYRNKMEYTFGDEYKGGPLALGLHRKNRFHEIVNTDHCLLVHEDMNRVRAFTRAYFEEAGVPFYHRMRHEGTLRFLVIRRARATGEILVNLITTSDEVDVEGWKDALTKLPLEGAVTSIYHTISDNVADAVKPEIIRHIYGKEKIDEELCGLTFHIGPFSFFQPNPWTAEMIYEKARNLLAGEKGVVFDLYSGTGTIAQIMAERAREVIGIEIVQEAVEQAQAAAVENGITNVRFMAGDVLNVVDELDQQPDCIVMDPPREGIHHKALSKIISYNAPKILYISCNPVTLKRDLDVLIAHGHQVEHIEAVDQFPKTVHVETIALIQKM